MRSRAWQKALTQSIARCSRAPACRKRLLSRECLWRSAAGNEASGAAGGIRARRATTEPAVLDALGSLFSFAGIRTPRRGFDQAAQLSRPTMHISFSNRATVRRFFSASSAPRKPTTTEFIALRPADFEAYKHRSDRRHADCRPQSHAELERVDGAGLCGVRGEVAIRYAALERSTRISATYRTIVRPCVRVARRSGKTCDVRRGQRRVGRWDGSRAVVSTKLQEAGKAQMAHRTTIIVGLPP